MSFQHFNGFPGFKEEDGTITLEAISDPRKYEAFKNSAKELNVKNLNFSGAFWKLPDLCILSDFPEIEEISITSKYVQYVGQLRELSNLRKLFIGEGIKAEFNFPDFPTVKDLYITKINFEQLVGLEELRLIRLGLDGVKKLKSLSELHIDPDDLEMLTISQDFSDLEGIEVFQYLKHLKISYCRKLKYLKSLDQLETNLEKLTISNCKKIEDFSLLENLKSLKDLRIYSCSQIANLQFVRGMEQLETFIFTDTIVLDGDMTPLLDRTWDYIYFHNKKHYTHTHTEVPALKHAEY